MGKISLGHVVLAGISAKISSQEVVIDGQIETVYTVSWAGISIAHTDYETALRIALDEISAKIKEAD